MAEPTVLKWDQLTTGMALPDGVTFDGNALSVTGQGLSVTGTIPLGDGKQRVIRTDPGAAGGDPDLGRWESYTSRVNARLRENEHSGYSDEVNLTITGRNSGQTNAPVIDTAGYSGSEYDRVRVKFTNYNLNELRIYKVGRDVLPETVDATGLDGSGALLIFGPDEEPVATIKHAEYIALTGKDGEVRRYFSDHMLAGNANQPVKEEKWNPDVDPDMWGWIKVLGNKVNINHLPDGDGDGFADKLEIDVDKKEIRYYGNGKIWGGLTGNTQTVGIENLSPELQEPLKEFLNHHVKHDHLIPDWAKTMTEPTAEEASQGLNQLYEYMVKQQQSAGLEK